MPTPDPIIDGDASFAGINMRVDPGQLPPGFCAFAKNKRFVNGKAATRPGIKKMPWTNKAADAWTNDNNKSYAIGDIVTYSGVAAAVSATTLAGISTGTLELQNANSLNLQNGTFASNAHWVFTGATVVAAQVGNNGQTYNSSSPFSIYSLSTALSSGDTITFQYGGVFTLSANASVGATSLQGTISVANVAFQEEASINSGWVYNSNGYAEMTSGTGLLNLYQDIGTLVGCSYVVTYSISNWTAGSVQPFISGSNSGTKRTFSSSATGTFTDTITPKGLKPERLYIQASGGFRGRIDNVTVTTLSLPDKVDLLGTYEQYTDFFRAAGPASNSTIGPYFKSKTNSNTNNPPITTYTPVNGNTPASSTLDSTNWEDLGQRTYGYGTVYGVGLFRDPSGVENLLIATAEGVYATKESSTSVLLPGITSITTDVEFVQCFNVVVMFRGETLPPMVMEQIGEGFKSITTETTDTTVDENDSDGTEEIPNASTGLFFSNRLLIPHSKDLVAASDFLNYTRYQPVLSNFRINQGSEDDLVSLVRVNSSTIACFKTDSIYVVSNIYGDMSDITLDEITQEYGAVGQRSIVQVGDDVVFLSSKRGVTSLGIASSGQISAVDVPLSEPIQPLIDRINWNYAKNAVAAYHNNRLYMAVPLDGSTHNNAILVYDYFTKAWAGHDSGEAIKVKRFIEATYQGKRRLFFLSTDGFINLYDDDLAQCGFVDERPTSTNVSDANFGKLTIDQVSDEITTRGYTANDISPKKWKSAEVQLETNNPNFTVKTVFDGPEEDDLTLTAGADGNPGSKTFSRTKYDRPFDKADFVESMANNDFFTKFRQDYSVDLNTNIQLPDATVANGVTTYNDAGFDPDLHQQSTNRYRFRGSGRYVQLNITNISGRAELVGAKVGATPGENLTTKLV